MWAVKELTCLLVIARPLTLTNPSADWEYQTPSADHSLVASDGLRTSTISVTARTTATTHCQAKFETRFSGLNILSHYTLSSARNNSDDYFIYDRSLNRGPADNNRE